MAIAPLFLEPDPYPRRTAALVLLPGARPARRRGRRRTARPALTVDAVPDAATAALLAHAPGRNRSTVELLAAEPALARLVVSGDPAEVPRRAVRRRLAANRRQTRTRLRNLTAAYSGPTDR